LFEKLFNKTPKTDSLEDVAERNLGDITSEKAQNLIKTLSGGEMRHTKKIIDNLIVFSNPSGGTGVSTLLSNIAYLAARQGLRVLVIDLNIMFPVQHLYFGNSGDELEKPDLMGFLLGEVTLGEAIQTKDNISLLVATNRGLMDSINAEADAATSNFQEGIQRLRQLFDLILIDCPMRIDHNLCNHAFYIADAIYMVWDEGISSISNTEKIRRNMALSGIDVYTKMRVILNKRTGIHYTKYPFDKLNMELVGILPFDQELIYSGLRSEIFCDKGASSSKVAAAFYDEMERITNTILLNGGKVD